MQGEVKVVGPLGKGRAAGGWYAISEGGVVSQARFVDQSAAWLSYREYTMRGAKAAKPSPKKRSLF